jgi:hypothetical protein
MCLGVCVVWPRGMIEGERAGTVGVVLDSSFHWQVIIEAGHLLQFANSFSFYAFTCVCAFSRPGRASCNFLILSNYYF